MRVKVVKDESKRIAAQLRYLSRQVVTVGVHGDAPRPTDAPELTMATLAAVHEFGDPAQHIPERSFLREAMTEHSPEIRKDITEKVVEMIEGKVKPGVVLNRAGVLILGSVRETITNGIKPELADITKKQRDKKAEHGGGLAANQGKYTPLVDTGQLIGSIVYRVDKKGA